ncbi:histone-lysine N-methyltransferase, H3 lysine-9 specific SUVH6-like [Olea europaea subsp. europaea]|uniref:Histone-lysine N-methyltransferase, H3 lysine-9 specific SUVH6-like n=1 Tax=Olea europaea subsp. europaea TaxID=158383 RepID=A0A8S0S7S0_OLEEU|nr:histone-lysine N-methyltransferase, H3 lysine-9 specific SUVH6-like [Olea europaea subsp. europaea]
MNGGLSRENSSKQELENGFIPKYKHRKVSAYRNFPPRCGGNNGPIGLQPDEKSNKEGEVYTLKSLPPGLPVTNGSIKQGTSPRPSDKYCQRRVSALRDFPPLCGRNAHRKTEEEPQGNTSTNDDLFTKIKETKVSVFDEIMTTSQKECFYGVEKVDEETRSAETLKYGIGRVPSVELLTENVNLGASQETLRTIVDGVPMKQIMNGGLGDDDIEKTEHQVSMPGAIDNCDEDTEGSVVKEIASYSGHEVHMEVVQCLMAAPYCPYRQKKVISWQQKYKSVARKSCLKEDNSGRPSRKKMVRVSGDSDGSPSAFAIVKDEEDFGANDKLRDFVLCLPAYGCRNNFSHDDARNRVIEALHLFHVHCRKLLQEEEAKFELEERGKSRKLENSPLRIDLRAAKIIKEKRIEVQMGKQFLGEVPGIHVGDEFQYRVELSIVGIHHPYQAGIDFMKHNGLLVATSIVASGGYADDMENADVLIYSGQGPQDHKLERGNLALRNSLSTKTPIRVIRGWKETTASDSSDSSAKIVSTYVYDGLYTVEKYWVKTGRHGKLVFTFELRRNPDQPKVAWKELKKSHKYRARSGICVKDISGGKELFPICVVNVIDNENPPKFNYITKMMYPDWFSPIPPQGCNCTGRCSDSGKCLCAVKNGGEIPFNHNGAIVEVKPLVYECGPSCKCPPSCYNRVSQHGIKIQLEIFKTESRGWGVRCPTFIPSGSFICEYAGELLDDKEAEQRIGNDEYLFDIGRNYHDSEKSVNLVEVWEEGFTIDAGHYGNIGRFINHSCSPNIYAQNVIYDHDDTRTPHVMLFAAENIPPLQELTYHYNYSLDQVLDSNGNIKIKRCHCGSAECSGRMY